MPGLDDLFTETPSDKALMDAIRTESTPPESEKTTEATETAETTEADTTAAAAETTTKTTEQTKPISRTVPIEALHEERQQRQAMQRELAELRAKKAPAEEEMDELKDPIGVIGRLKGEINEFKAWQQRQADEQDLGNRVAARINSYAKENPDYTQQYLFLQASRVTELRALGNDDAAIAKQIRAEEMDLGRIALAQDKNPGELISALSLARGWQKSAAPALVAAAAPAPAAAAQPANQAESSEDRIDRLERGRRAAQSSSGSGGRASNSDDLSIEDIVNLEGAAFDKAAAAFIARERRAGR